LKDSLEFSQLIAINTSIAWLLKIYFISDEIVISGIGGRFPESDNLDEFAENLFANRDLITDDETRWPKGN
jgi:hypothetical protein